MSGGCASAAGGGATASGHAVRLGCQAAQQARFPGERDGGERDRGTCGVSLTIRVGEGGVVGVVGGWDDQGGWTGLGLSLDSRSRPGPGEEWLSDCVVVCVVLRCWRTVRGWRAGRSAQKRPWRARWCSPPAWSATPRASQTPPTADRYIETSSSSSAAACSSSTPAAAAGASSSSSSSLVLCLPPLPCLSLLTRACVSCQILTLTVPMVGNYGVPDPKALDALGLPKAFESYKIHASGLVVQVQMNGDPLEGVMLPMYRDRDQGYTGPCLGGSSSTCGEGWARDGMTD
jgi:hypothetical protein